VHISKGIARVTTLRLFFFQSASGQEATFVGPSSSGGSAGCRMARISLDGPNGARAPQECTVLAATRSCRAVSEEPGAGTRASLTDRSGIFTMLSS
jgi:hypothetical protein